MVLLNGAPVDAGVIDPAKHRFIGMFRPPTRPPTGAGVYPCSCGELLQLVNQVFEHWQSGHFDHLQYVSIENADA